MNPTVPMNGFCINYCLALIAELKRLHAAGELFKGRTLEPTGRTIVSCLNEQVRECPPFNDATDLDKFVKHIESFIAIFEEKDPAK